MAICCCSLAGTRACFTCPNSMAGIWDRYPGPYISTLWISTIPVRSNEDEADAQDQQVSPV